MQAVKEIRLGIWLYLFFILNTVGVLTGIPAMFLSVGIWLKGISIFFFLTAFIILSGIIFPKLRFYRGLCKDFSEGKIYDDFIKNGDGITEDFGKSLRRLDELIDRKNSLQLSTKQAEFLALQNQINPHFLYNTLESIRGDAVMAGMYDLADITEALSTFFRYTITNTKNLATIQDELDNVDNYFLIQHYRFGDKLSLEVEIPDDRKRILQMKCPKLFMQPIVENAIFHGLEKKSVNGLVTIHIEQVDEMLLVSISDNGSGIPAETLNKLNTDLARVSIGAIPEKKNTRKKGGIAMKNVCRRIKLLFGEEYGMQFSSIEGLGTRVDVTLPITDPDEQENLQP